MNIKKVTCWSDRILRICYYALIFFLPIASAFVEVISAFIITIYFTKRCLLFAADPENFQRPFPQKIILFFKAFLPRPHPVHFAVGTFLFFNLISSIFSRIPEESWETLVGSVFQAVMLYVGVHECFQKRKHWETFTICFLLSIALMVLNSGFQFFTGQDIVQHRALARGRVMSSFKHPNDFGTYLVFAITWLLGLLTVWFTNGDSRISGWLRHWAVKVSLGLLLCGALLALGFTYSRGAWIGFLSALLWLGMQRKRFFIFFVIIGVLFLATFSSGLISVRNVSFISDDVRRDVQREKAQAASPSSGWFSVWEEWKEKVVETSAMGRRDFWGEAAAIMVDYPLFGSGPHTYSHMVREYQLSDHLRVYPHNCFLQMGAETGTFGLAAFLWLILLLFMNGLHDIKRMTDPFLSAALLGVMGGLVGIWVHSFLDTAFYSIQLGNLMWLMMGAVGAIPRMDENLKSLSEFSNTMKPKDNQKKYLIFLVIIFVLLAGLRLIESRKTISKYGRVLVSVGQQYEKKGNSRKALQYYLRALRHNPQLPDAYDALGSYFYRQGDYRDALKNLQIAIALNPAYHEAFYHLGMALRENGQPERAIAAFTRAVELQHGNGQPEYFYERGVTYLKIGKRNEALMDAYSAEWLGNKKLADKLLDMFDQ